MRHVLFAFVALATSSACGGSTTSDVGQSSAGGASGASGAGGSSAGAGGSSAGAGGSGAGTGGAGGGAGASCDGFVAKATPEQIAKTPRPDAAAEILAVETAGTFVADDALYERVSAELGKIATLDPSVAGIGPMSSVSNPSIVLRFDTPTFAVVMAGNYHAWDCQNAAYGVTKISQVGTLAFFELDFGERRYDTLLLVKEYVALPGVIAADPNGIGGDGPDVCLQIDGDVHHYIFDQASGDCPAGCIDHVYTGFEASPGLDVKSLGTYVPANPTPEPAWFAALKDCQSRL